ncbi:MAG: hypothetical protein RLY71_2629 [Pseudomonadota bacterium]|jgi:hypothetical protein
MDTPAQNHSTQQATDRDEVFRRMGRNLLHFQHIEQLLKFLIANARLEGPLPDLGTILEVRTAKVHTQTMGHLAGRLVDDLYIETRDIAGELDDQADDGASGFRFSVLAEPTVVAQDAAELRAVVESRNELIHHFLPRWNPTCIESTRAAMEFLDGQRAKALPVLEQLKSTATSLASMRDQHAQLLASPEFRQNFELLWLRSSRLVQLLAEIAEAEARADGWMSLAVAGTLIKRREPAELEEIAERYGHKTLKQVLLASGYFDVLDESTPGGGRRTIYCTNAQFQADRDDARNPAS